MDISTSYRSDVRYSPDGKLTQQTWARGITTSYGYDTVGSLTNILYSDNTPSVTFAYDRLGRQTNAVQRSTGVPPNATNISCD